LRGIGDVAATRISHRWAGAQISRTLRAPMMSCEGVRRICEEALVDSRVAAVLTDYDRRAAQEAVLMRELGPEEIMRRVDEFLISIGPDTGMLLNILIKAARAQTILEIGTSYGHSTVFFAEAARSTGGRVISLDISADKQRYAREQLAAAGLDALVEFRTGDARDRIAALPGPLDFVLIDLWKDLYVPCFDLVYPKLSAGAFVAADNILFPEFWRDDMVAYRRHVRGKTEMESVLLAATRDGSLGRGLRSRERHQADLVRARRAD
jgi:predicted O-methyltransferase YrrM